MLLACLPVILLHSLTKICTPFLKERRGGDFYRERERKRKKERKKEIYIYIFFLMLMKLLTGPSLGVFKAINWAKSKLLTGTRSFSRYKNRGFKWFCFAQLSLCFLLFPIIWQFSENSLFQQKGAEIGFFNFLCFKFEFWKLSFLVCQNTIKKGFQLSFVFLLLKEKKKAKKW